MKKIIASTAVLLLCSLVTVSSADLSLDAFGIEASLSGGYSTNLLNDFTQFENYAPGTHLALKYYPAANLEFKGSYDRSWIRSQLEVTDNPNLSQQERDSILAIRDELVETLNSLSTVTTGLHFTYIPTGVNSQFSVYFTGGVGRRAYDARDSQVIDTIGFGVVDTTQARDFQIYNTTDYDITVAVGYQHSPRVHFRGEVAYKYNDYTDAEFLDDIVNSKQTVDFVAGGNWSIAGTNVLDIELGLSGQAINRTFIDSADAIDSSGFPWVYYDVVTDGKDDLSTRTLYLSPRFSRQLGERTGANLTLTYRSFVSGSDIIVAGEAASLLDPFATIWEGMGARLTIKTFIIPRLITTFGVGFWDKTYLRHMEGYRDPRYPATQYRVADREDQKSSIYVGLQMPLPKTWGGLSFEPVFSAQYGDNSSTIETYDHFGWDLALGVSLKR